MTKLLLITPPHRPLNAEVPSAWASIRMQNNSPTTSLRKISCQKRKRIGERMSREKEVKKVEREKRRRSLINCPMFVLFF